MPARAQIPAFTPSDNVKIETDPTAKGPPVDTPMAADDETRIEELLTDLEARVTALGKGFAMAAIPFEKDDDANGHMDLITALANMRARNYHIPEARPRHPSFCHIAAHSALSPRLQKGGIKNKYMNTTAPQRVPPQRRLRVSLHVEKLRIKELKAAARLC